MATRELLNSLLYSAGIKNFELKDDNLSIQFYIYNEDLRDYKHLSLKFYDVDHLRINSAPGSDYKMIYDDGECVEMTIKENETFILVEWNDFKNHEHVTKSYDFTYSKYDVENIAPPAE